MLKPITLPVNVYCSDCKLLRGRRRVFELLPEGIWEFFFYINIYEASFGAGAQCENFESQFFNLPDLISFSFIHSFLFTVSHT